MPSFHPTKHPEVSQCAKIQGFGLSKTTLQVPTYPIKPPKFHNTLKSKVSDYPKHPSKFPYTHEVREFLTIHPLQRPRPNTHTTPPRSILGSLIASKIRYLSREKFTLGVSTDHRPRHRERAVIRLCACRKMPNTLADVNLP